MSRSVGWPPVAQMVEPAAGSPQETDPPSGLGPYRLEEVVATGGCSTVYLGRHRSIGCEVAIKVARSRPRCEAGGTPDAERLAGESSVLDQVQGRAIVRKLDAGYDQGFQYLVLELADGGTLGARLRGGNRGSTAAAAVIARAIATALHVTHRAGFVHRDVNPANILIRGRPNSRDADLVDVADDVVLCDFGLAVPMGDTPEIWTLNGTRLFRAPEQESRGASIGVRADVYAATALIVSVISGRLPPAAYQVEGLLPWLQPRWQAFIAQGMNANPLERFGSIDKWYEAFATAAIPDLEEPDAML